MKSERLGIRMRCAVIPAGLGFIIAGLVAGGAAAADVSWQQVAGDGFGSPDNLFSGSVVDFRGVLYISTGSAFPWVQAEVWRTPPAESGGPGWNQGAEPDPDRSDD